MKRIIYTLFVLAVITAGCDDSLRLTPLDNLTQDTYYTNQQEIGQAVTGVYSAMINGTSTGGFDVNLYLLASEVRSNNYDAVSANGSRDWYDISRFLETSSTQTLETIWEQCYQLIYYANEVLENIDDVTFTEDTLKARYKAEVRFLRAYTCFKLVQVFGRVPLIDHVVTISEAKGIPRTGLDELYDFLITELGESARDLPAEYSGNEIGRVTKWAAYALLGKVCLTRAGYPLNETGYLDQARTNLELVIDQEGAYVTFAGNYADLFKVENRNKYCIFEIQHESGGTGVGTVLPSYFAPYYGNADPRYNINGPELHGTEDLIVSEELKDSYEDGDLRFAATIDTVYINSNGDKTKSDFFVKFREPGLTIVDRYDWPASFPVIRYADVLLMYAEVLNNQGQTADAVPYLNRIRERAGLPGIAASVSGTAFRAALEKERRTEFAGEGVYWHDLVRWDKALNVMNDWFQQNGEGVTITRDDYLYPVPLSQIEACGYEQNP